jgi:hypothetical protein
MPTTKQSERKTKKKPWSMTNPKRYERNTPKNSWTMVNPNYKFGKSLLNYFDLKNVPPCTRELHTIYMEHGKSDEDFDIMVTVRPRTSAWPKRDESSNTLPLTNPLLTNHQTFNLLLTNQSLSKCAFCLTSSLPCILPPYNLFFLTNRNMAVEVEKTRAAVGFLDHECLCSTTLNNMNNTLAFFMSYMCNTFKRYAKKNFIFTTYLSKTTRLQWRSFRSSERSTLLIH